MTDPLLQDPVGGEPDRVLDPLVFQVLGQPKSRQAGPLPGHRDPGQEAAEPSIGEGVQAFLGLAPQLQLTPVSGGPQKPAKRVGCGN